MRKGITCYTVQSQRGGELRRQQRRDGDGVLISHYAQKDGGNRQRYQRRPTPPGATSFLLRTLEGIRLPQDLAGIRSEPCGGAHILGTFGACEVMLFKTIP